MPEIFKNKNFLYLYIAGFTSELGSFALNNALLLYIYQLTDQNPAFIGISQAIFISFFMLGSLLGGAIAEKRDKKQVLLFCEFIRLPIVCLFFFTQNVYLLFLLKGFIAFFTGVFNPSRMAFINYLVPKENINKANSIFGTTIALLHIFGPIIGTQMYASTKAINSALVFDLISYLIGIFFLWQIQFKNTLEFDQGKSVLHELKEGFKYIFANKDFTSILLFATSIGICIGVLITMFLPFTTAVLGQKSSFYGNIISSFGVGGLFGGLLCHLISKKLSLGKIIIFTVFLEVIMMFIWINTHHPYMSLFLLFIWGTLVFVRITAQLNYVSAFVTPQYLTRVHSLLDMSFNVPQILAGALIGVIGGTIAVSTILEWNAIIFCLLISAISLLGGTKTLIKRV